MTKAHLPYSSTDAQDSDASELDALVAELVAEGFEPAFALHCARDILAPLAAYAAAWDADAAAVEHDLASYALCWDADTARSGNPSAACPRPATS